MSSHTRVQAKDGVATIEHLYIAGRFLGSSGSGEFPPPGQQYHAFTFRPSKGEPGILVFWDSGVHDSYAFYQYWWENEKVIVKSVSFEYIANVAHPYSYSRDLGFVVHHEGSLYVTVEPKGGLDTNYTVVNLFTMLRFLEGKIGVEDLDRGARAYERKKRHLARVKELEQRLTTLKTRVDNAMVEWCNILMERIFITNEDIRAMADEIGEAIYRDPPSETGSTS